MDSEEKSAAAAPIRREVMKLGAAVVAALGSPLIMAQTSAERPGPAIFTRTGWKNDANRAFGNGPIDDTKRKFVEYVKSFSESSVKGPLLASLNLTIR